MEALIAGLFGLIIGSFINVLVLRYPARSLGGRSMCMSCGGEIAWYDNIPLFSWIFLRGHCRRCGSAISVQYPLVEATTGAIFALVSASSDISAGISGLYAAALLIPMLFIAALLIAIATYDIKHTIIPDAWAYTFAATAFLYGGANGALDLALGSDAHVLEELADLHVENVFVHGGVSLPCRRRSRAASDRAIDKRIEKSNP